MCPCVSVLKWVKITFEGEQPSVAPFGSGKSCLNQLCKVQKFGDTVRPQDTRPRASRTSQVHIFELGPKKFEMNELK